MYSSAKRRRLADPASTLAKPFRSPLPASAHPKQSGLSSTTLTDPSQVHDHGRACRASPDLPSLEPEASSERLPSLSSSHGSPRGATITSKDTHTIISRPHSSPTKVVRDPDYFALQKQHSALVLQFRQVSTAVETSTQALKICTSDADKDLERLIQKWRLVSREVAEELFSVAKDRVNRMGGVGAWREKFSRSGEDESNPWDQEQNIDEDELTNEEKEQLEIAREDARREAEKYGLLDKPKSLHVEQDDDSFTMDMMLKQLHVDLDIVGYDVHAQRWID